MRARVSFLVPAALAALAVACTRHEEAAPKQVAGDLKRYVAQMQKWEGKEKQVFDAMAEVEQSQFVDDELVVRTLKGALLPLDEHIRELAAYQPSSPDLREIHDRYRKGWEDLKSAFDAVISAVEGKDYVRLASAKRQMEAARARLLATVQELDTALQQNEQELEDMQKS